MRRQLLQSHVSAVCPSNEVERQYEYGSVVYCMLDFSEQ